MTGLTVLVLVLAGLRLVILIVEVVADRTPAPRAVPPVRVDPCLGPFVAGPPEASSARAGPARVAGLVASRAPDAVAAGPAGAGRSALTGVPGDA